jgi:protein-tyrosine phosphatase
MIKILFLCTGNICRSPLAEGIFKDLAAKQNLSVYCDSAGTENYHVGSLPDIGSQQVGKKYGLTLTHKSRQLLAKDFEKFDYILAMDNHNVERANIIALKTQNKKAKMQLFRLYDSDKSSPEVADPYFRGEKAFEECYQTLLRCCNGFLQYLLEIK